MQGPVMKLFASTVLAAAMIASAASAQTPAASNPGPVIPGVCTINLEGVLATSNAGQAISRRMGELREQVAAEVGPYYQAVQTGLDSLQQSGASLPEAQRNQQAQQLRQRYEEAQQLEQTRQAELNYTGQQQLRTLATAAQPVIDAVYAERGCGLLLSADAVIQMNPAMDVSRLVVDRINAAVQANTSFNRLPVPVQTQAPAQ